RLSFAQLVAVAKASSPHALPSHWTWKAIGELNKLRNLLAHEASPRDLVSRMKRYNKMVESGIGHPLPKPAMFSRGIEVETHTVGHTLVDVATCGLYYYVAALWRFDTSEIGKLGLAPARSEFD